MAAIITINIIIATNIAIVDRYIIIIDSWFEAVVVDNWCFTMVNDNWIIIMIENWCFTIDWECAISWC
jgi:hypothetical protein